RGSDCTQSNTERLVRLHHMYIRLAQHIRSRESGFRAVSHPETWRSCAGCRSSYRQVPPQIHGGVAVHTRRLETIARKNIWTGARLAAHLREFLDGGWTHTRLGRSRV